MVESARPTAAHEPFHVLYWEIGNEIWGDWVRGHSDASTYANNLNRYVQKMKAIDPSIKIIATGDNDLRLEPNGSHHRWPEHRLLIRSSLLRRQREMKGDANNLRARPLHYERFIDKCSK